MGTRMQFFQQAFLTLPTYCRCAFLVCVVLSMLLGSERPTWSADDAAVRQQSVELAELVSHHGAMFGVPDRMFYCRDDDRYREVMNRLAKDGATPEIREIAKNCQSVAQSLDRSHRLWDELTKDRTGPGKSFFGMMAWVADQSIQGNFQFKTKVRTVNENGITIDERTEMRDHSLTAALFYGTVGFAMNQAAERQHQASVFKLRLNAARELTKIEDQVEQLRFKSAQKLVALGFAPFAGQPRPEPRLEVKLGQEKFDSSVIDKFLDEEKRQAAWAQREKERMDRIKRGEPDIGYEQRIHPMLSLRNPGPPLHRVGLTIDYYHYRLPDKPVMRQFFWLPEWKTNEVFAITEAFRLNLENRAMAGLREDVHGKGNIFGHPVFPGFLGLVRIKYSLLSDELRQEDVVVELNENRDMIRDTMLRNSEDLAMQLINATSSTGDWLKLPGPEKAARTKLGNETVKEFASAALAIAPEEWAESGRAKALLKDFKAVNKQVEAVRTDVLGACRAGSVYRGTRSSEMAHQSYSSGTFELEFTSAKSAQAIEVTITRTDRGTHYDPPVQRYTGKLVPLHDRDKGRVHASEFVLSLTLVPPKAPEGKKPAANKGTIAKNKPKGKAPETPPPEAAPVQSGSTRPSGVRPMTWELAWVKDRWVCTWDKTEFAFVTRKEPEEIGKPKKFNDDAERRPSDTANGPPAFAPNTTWEGTRVFTDDKGKELSRQKLKFVIREYPGVVASGGPHIEMIRFGEFLVDDKPVGAYARLEIHKVQAGKVRVRISVAPQPITSRTQGQELDSLEGEFKNGVLGGVVHRFVEPMNTPKHHAWELKVKK